MRMRNVKSALLSSLFALAVHSAAAAEPSQYAGTWTLRIGDRTLFVLTLKQSGDQLTGSYDQPTHWSANRNLFSDIAGPVRHDPVTRAAIKDGVLHFTDQNPTDPKDTNAYVFTLNGDRAELTDDDLPPGLVDEPRVFTRGPEGASVSTNWEPNRSYVPGDSDAACAEMKTIYDEDQRVRGTDKIDWNVVGKSDAERRVQTKKLLADGALHTGKDFEEASFVFQHGDKPDDYLLAHTLAMVAVSKGDSSAIWIAAATLDRYLENIKQKQIFGTQYSSDNKNGWTQEPYDRTLVSDALRDQLGVQPQALQAKQLQAYQAIK
jgi:hypothetical protein